MLSEIICFYPIVDGYYYRCVFNEHAVRIVCALTLLVYRFCELSVDPPAKESDQLPDGTISIKYFLTFFNV